MFISNKFGLDETIQKLKENGNSINSSYLIDQVIAMQLTKLNNGKITKTDTIEVATSNLIDLLKMREKYR